MFRRLLLPNALLVAAPLGAQTPPIPPKIFTDLLAVRSLGVGTAFESSPDGEWLFVGEAGSLAVIKADSQAEYYHPRTILPLSTQGVMPAALALDPEATAPYGDSREDLLYVAGGRDGLWAVEANTGQGLTGLDIGLIDDAAGNIPLMQNSRRWCNDLGFMSITVEGMPRIYLLALFARTDNTRLRVYEIERVRSVVRDHPQEVGHSILADVNVLIGRHPEYPVFDPLNQRSRSFGFGIAVDRVSDAQTDVYVATGEHGLARVRFTSASFASPTVTWGPVFGTQSQYDDTDDLYDDLSFIRSDTAATDVRKNPLFTDVVVQRNSWGHFLYAGVDHLGWVRFDLEDPWTSDPAQTPIDHHEGAPLTNSVGERQTRLVPPTSETNGKTFVRRLSLLDRGDHIVLGVAAAEQSMALMPDYRSEGQVLNSDFWGVNGVTPPAAGPLAGTEGYTILYRLSATSSLNDQAINGAYAYAIPGGGDEIVLFPDQQVADPLVEFFAGRSGKLANLAYDVPIEFPILGTTLNMTWRSRVDLGTEQELIRLERAQNHRIGTRVHAFGVFRGAPDVLIRGSNDCCTYDDGINVICSSGFETDYDPTWVGSQGGGDDDRGTFGVWFNPDAHWKRSVDDDWYVWGTGDPPSAGTPDRYALTRFHPGTTLCPIGQPDPPSLYGRWYLEPSDDRWGQRGRQYWMATLDEQYDAEHDQAANGWKLIFATRGGTPDGLIAARRDMIQQFVDDPTKGPGEYFFADIENHFPPPNAKVFSAWLDTHPEFQNIPLSETNFLSRNGLLGIVQTFFPTLFKVRGPGSSAPDVWVMGVPCGVLALRPDLPDILNNPTWAPPAAYLSNYDHALVRLWHVQDPQQVVPPSGGPPLLPISEVIGPDARALAIGLDVYEWAGSTLCFLTDHGGRVLVYDITSILQPSGGPVLLHTWTTPLCISDDVPNPIRTAVLDHAEWTYDGQPRSELYLYVGVQRVGIQILRWNHPAQRLEPVQLVETAGEAYWLQKRVDLQGNRTLLVGDGMGLRLYGYAF